MQYYALSLRFVSPLNRWSGSFLPLFALIITAFLNLRSLHNASSSLPVPCSSTPFPLSLSPIPLASSSPPKQTFFPAQLSCSMEWRMQNGSLIFPLSLIALRPNHPLFPTPSNSFLSPPKSFLTSWSLAFSRNLSPFREFTRYRRLIFNTRDSN